MDRRSRHRIGKCEELLSAALKERDKRLRQFLRVCPIHARYHATAVAAIVLSGQPRVDEPLRRAWARALQHYKINVNDQAVSWARTLRDQAEWPRQVAAARRLRPIILGREQESARFSKIFSNAPVWLLQFTGMAMDARLLKFHLPGISQTLTWGSDGFGDAQRWPLLPLGTMMAGDPIPDLDPRRLWITLCCQITEPFPDVEDLSRKDKEIRSHQERDPHLQDLLLAVDLDGKPESKWSAYEKRRMRKFSEWFSRSER